jgi:beta-galactosidase
MAQRRVISLNQNWTMEYVYDVPMRQPAKQVTLPHTFNADETYNGPRYTRTTAQYQHTLADTVDLRNKRVFLRFEGVNSQATVLVNGKTAGQHSGGYTAFCLEITGLLKPEKNQIVVFASNAFSTDVLPLSGDFNVYGGIHRPVSLLLTEKDCITPIRFASSGVYVRTPTVSEQQAKVEVETHLSLSDNQSGLSLLAEILDNQGNTLVREEKPVSGGSSTFSFQLQKPRLWNGKADPYLYSTRVSLKKRDKVLDEVKENFGIRYFRVDAEKGFFLNGSPLGLHGVCRHEDVAVRGSALLPEDHQRDMDLVMEIGATAMRLTHYPHSKPFYHLADKNGLVLWTEIPLVGPGGYPGPGYLHTPGLHAHARQILTEMIHQHYNHPSVFFWGLFNELKLDYDDPRPLIDSLNLLAKQLDPHRPTTIASFLADSLFIQSSDLIAWNKYYGWYGGEPTQLGEWLDGFHRKYPNKPVSVSEYGAGASIHHQSDTLIAPQPGGKWHPEQWQTYFHIGNWSAIKQRPFVWGSFIWVLADFGSSIRTEGDTTGMNDKGLVTYDRRTKKDAFYFYKAQWNKQPMVHIADKRMTKRAANTGIRAFTNLPELVLYINGKMLAKAVPDTNGIALWNNVQLQPGQNNIAVAGSGKQAGIKDETVLWMESSQ